MTGVRLAPRLPLIDHKLILRRERLESLDVLRRRGRGPVRLALEPFKEGPGPAPNPAVRGNAQAEQTEQQDRGSRRRRAAP